MPPKKTPKKLLKDAKKLPEDYCQPTKSNYRLRSTSKSQPKPKPKRKTPAKTKPRTKVPIAKYEAKLGTVDENMNCKNLNPPEHQEKSFHESQHPSIIFQETVIHQPPRDSPRIGHRPSTILNSFELQSSEEVESNQVNCQDHISDEEIYNQEQSSSNSRSRSRREAIIERYKDIKYMQAGTREDTKKTKWGRKW